MAENNSIQSAEDALIIRRRENLKFGVRADIFGLEKGHLSPDNTRILTDKGDYVQVCLKYGIMTIWQMTISKDQYNPIDYLHQLMRDIDDGKFDKCLEEALNNRKNKRAKSKRSLFNYPRGLSEQLNRYPNLNKIIKQYIKNGGSETESISDLTMYFKQIYHRYAVKIDEIFNLLSKTKVKKFNLSDNDSRWLIIEEYIKKHFRKSVIVAIEVANDYGDAFIDRKKQVIFENGEYTLTDKQKKELMRFPLLRGYVNSFIRNEGCADRLFTITEFTRFFKKLWFSGVDELELFPRWEEEAFEYYKNPEYIPPDNWYANFINGGSHSSWSYGEEYVQVYFSECVDNAIRLAKKYGDVDINAK